MVGVSTELRTLLTTSPKPKIFIYKLILVPEKPPGAEPSVKGIKLNLLIINLLKGL